MQRIAQEAGVSTATVSRVLNNHPKIDADTRSRVIAIADQLGYKGASAPRANLSMALSVILDRPGQTPAEGDVLGDDYGSFLHIQRMIVSIEQATQAQGYQLMLISMATLQRELPPAIQQRGVDGAIVIGGYFPEKLIAEVAQAVPTVIAGGALPSSAAHAVHMNYQRSAAEVVDHLVGLGHRRIALLNGPRSSLTSAEKLGGYCQRCAYHGLELDSSLIIYADSFDIRDGYAATEQLFRQGSFTALVGATDVLCQGALQVAHTRGLELPRDLSLVSLYNSGQSLMWPSLQPLTGVRAPHELVGQLAVERLLAQIAQPSAPMETVVPAELRLGASSGPAPA